MFDVQYNSPGAFGGYSSGGRRFKDEKEIVEWISTTIEENGGKPILVTSIKRLK